MAGVIADSLALAYDVSRRGRELGVRSALRATRAGVVCMLLRDSMRRALVGILAGVGASLGCSRLLADLLFGLTATDSAVYIGSILGVGIVTCAASLVDRHA